MLSNMILVFVFAFIISNSFWYGFSSSCVKAPIRCSKTKYRSIDGSCNNLKHPEWGMSNSTYGRLLPPIYGDGIHSLPVAKSGNPLPGARTVSLALYPNVSIEDKLYTLLTMQYGQIITHDMSLTVFDLLPIACCTQNGRNLDSAHLPKQCLPVQVSEDDPDFSKANITCISVVRTATDKDRSCSKANQPAEQLSQVTAFLDLSNVYGSDKETAEYMREYEGGLIRVDIRNGQQWPIRSTNRVADCLKSKAEDLCYFGSDPRVNQNAQLTVLQIIYLRDHNRIADTLAKLNPHWNDETIFQEARKIAIAAHQYITYYEWLPIMLGRDHLLRNRVLYETDSFVNDYNKSADPSVLNEHSNAAFRFFHTLIPGRLELVGEHREPLGSLGLSDWNFQPKILEVGDNFDGLTRGMCTQHQMGSDRYHDKEVTTRLFRFGAELGVDLKAIDLQRNREHGLASYNDMRQYCGLARARRFQDFVKEIPLDVIEKLLKLYETPDDVDLSVGGTVETNLPGTHVGPTFHCIILKQFGKTRSTDRFWFESDGETGFTLKQLREIRKSSISRLLCDNGNNIKTMQANGFLGISKDNYLRPCDSLPAMNLTLWKDAQN